MPSELINAVVIGERIAINGSEPTEKEVTESLKTFKNNKSGGTEKLKTEGLKYNQSRKLVEAILKLLVMIWTMIVIPTMWLHSSITCLYKKGAMSEAKKLQGTFYRSQHEQDNCKNHHGKIEGCV